MTIVMIGHKGVPSRSGGIERHVEELSAGLVRHGARVISYDRPWYVENAPSPAGVERRWSAGICTKHFDAITHTFSAIWRARQDKPDIVHIHGVGPSLLAPFARLVHPHARVIVTFHTIDRISPKWGFVARTMLHLGERFACVFAHRTIVVSNTLATYCLEAYQCQTVVIPNGVRLPASADASYVERLNLVPGQYSLMVTRLVPHKNVHQAIEAQRMLASRNPELAAAFPLVIVGASSRTDAYARDLAKQAFSVPGVRLLGERHGAELAALQAYATCHLSIASSEGMSVALLEALAFARPVIVSSIPENMEVTGKLAPSVPAGDAVALSAALERLITSTETDRNAMGQTLRARACENHDWERITDMTLAVYNELLLEQAVATEKLAY